MTTIAYANGLLATDGAHVVKVADMCFKRPYDQHKGIIIYNPKGRAVGVVAITGQQPPPEFVAEFQKYFGTKPFDPSDIKGFSRIWGAGVDAILMFRDAAYTVSRTDNEKPDIKKIDSFGVVGSGSTYAITLLRLGNPIETLMSSVHRFDSLTSPQTYLIRQSDLDGFEGEE